MLLLKSVVMMVDWCLCIVFLFLLYAWHAAFSVIFFP